MDEKSIIYIKYTFFGYFSDVPNKTDIIFNITHNEPLHLKVLILNIYPQPSCTIFFKVCFLMFVVLKEIRTTKFELNALLNHSSLNCMNCSSCLTRTCAKQTPFRYIYKIPNIMKKKCKCILNGHKIKS